MGSEAVLNSCSIFVGHRRGKLGLYVTVFPYGAAVMHGTTLRFVMNGEGLTVIDASVVPRPFPS